MGRITPETERKLMAVINKTAAFVSNGMRPNDAIVKAAQEGSLRPGEVSLVVHAYNTGRTTRQREDGSDLFEKSAEFELADTAAVLESMYPTNVKTAAAREHDSVVSPEYSYGPRPMLERKQQWEKRSQAIDWRTIAGEAVTPPPPLPTDPRRAMRVMSADLDRIKRAAEESRRKMASAFDQLGKAFTDLTTYFQRPDAHPLPVVKEAVILLHGGKGEQLMDQLVKVTPGLTKLSQHRTGTGLLSTYSREKFAASVDSLDCTQAPFDMVAAVMTAITEYQTKKAEYDSLVATSEKEAGSILRPFVQPASQSILGPLSDEHEKLAHGIDVTDPLKMLGTYSLLRNNIPPALAKLKGPDNDTRVNKVVGELNDPSHEARLREINTQGMLQDLMLNDDVISGYDPHEVTGAFNDIVQISPSVADQRMLMQSLLRKKLQQGQLDTFDQDQLLGFEDKLRRQSQPIAGKADGSII